MITRIVKLSFNKGKGDFFIEEFEKVAEKIRGFEGNLYLEGLQNIDDPDVVFTYSKWSSQAALDNYRKSDVFGSIWPKIKKEFRSKPEAWSANVLKEFK